MDNNVASSHRERGERPAAFPEASNTGAEASLSPPLLDTRVDKNHMTHESQQSNITPSKSTSTIAALVHLKLRDPIFVSSSTRQLPDPQVAQRSRGIPDPNPTSQDFRLMRSAHAAALPPSLRP
ncbi:uncharacterized protein BP5553_03344 [Venustampulla echinocandica]|uniref:Uncharacterized protein n=1 Tax=Venustampulla echinocandica TaxID=2656787 RepID=A0A370TU12_9HELO|nr:uncharacterized protein BP5553_03344 [Venustampulla echinocandica]RDL39004.1 hypothetical protein BP5553_03344 [Venustampulla echinocandica]